MFATQLFPFMIVAFLIDADEPKKDETAKDVERFQGTWILTSIENNGQLQPPESIKGRKLVVKGNDTVLLQGEEVYSRSTQKLDATKTPRQIDITQTDGKEKNKVTRGIYSLVGDSLTICYAYPGDGRPSELKAGKGSGCILLKFEREKR